MDDWIEIRIEAKQGRILLLALNNASDQTTNPLRSNFPF